MTNDSRHVHPVAATPIKGPSWLASLDSARAAIEQVRTVDEAVELLDAAEVAKVYAKNVMKSREAQNHAAQIALECQRKAGELLSTTVKRGGDRAKLHGVTLLSDLGVSKVQSSRWQKTAKVPDDVFRDYVDQTTEADDEITTAGLLRYHNALNAQAKRADQRDRTASLADKDVPLPDRRYAVIYADPPWRYDFSPTDARAIENQYPTLDVEDIAAIDVPAADDAVLFMWATNPKLTQAFEVLAGWNFEYVTNMVWVKDRIGMGYYARSRHELLLIAKRGQLATPEPTDRPDSVIEAPRGRHSAKPDLVYELLERMYPNLPKLEMFCRSPREGWDAWGNEVAA